MIWMSIRNVPWHRADVAVAVERQKYPDGGDDRTDDRTPEVKVYTLPWKITILYVVNLRNTL